jgi:hypothetical protein
VTRCVFATRGDRGFGACLVSKAGACAIPLHLQPGAPATDYKGGAGPVGCGRVPSNPLEHRADDMINDPPG